MSSYMISAANITYYYIFMNRVFLCIEIYRTCVHYFYTLGVLNPHVNDYLMLSTFGQSFDISTI